MSLFDFHIGVLIKPVASITTPEDGFVILVDTDQDWIGTAEHATSVDIWANVDGGGWGFWVGPLTVVANAWYASAQCYPTGSWSLKAVAHGPGGDTWSDVITGTVVGA